MNHVGFCKRGSLDAAVDVISRYHAVIKRACRSGQCLLLGPTATLFIEVSLKRLAFILFLLMVFGFSALYHAPARLLASAMPPTLGVNTWGGTLFNGQVLGAYKQKPFFITWQWRASELWRLRLTAQASVAGPFDALMAASKSPLGWHMDLTDVRLPAGESVLLGPGTSIPAWQSPVLTIARASNGQWTQANGAMITAGGLLRLNLQGQVQEINLPSAALTWSLNEGNLVGDLRQRDGNMALATLTLTHDDRIQWQIRDRLLRLKPNYTSTNSPDLIVLTVAEPL